MKCLCWSFGHAEQLLFSCLCSKVSVCNYVTFRMSHCLCQMSHCAFHMSCVKCLCWSLVHSEQLLFSCVSSKVIIYNYVTCHMSYVTCLMSNAYVDPWEMVNNFCFHVYAQKWVLVFMSHVTCHILHVTCHIAHVTCHI